MKRRCVVCDRKPLSEKATVCRYCWSHIMGCGDTTALVVFVARRARRFERARQKRGK